MRSRRVRTSLLLISRVASLLLVVGVLSACGMFQPQQQPERPQSEPDIQIKMENGSVETKPLEEYVAGVVAAEMETDWPVEALGAQAILARTFTVNKAQEAGGFDDFVITTDETEFQAYDASLVTERVTKAVEQTRGEVIMYNGNPVNAWFHSCAGGKTATSEEGLAFEGGPTPYLQPVESDFDCGDKKTWEASFDPSELKRAAETLGQTISGSITAISVSETGPSGRAKTVTVNDDIPLSGPKLRNELGPEKMRSTLLTHLGLEGSRINMSGKGFGHGVGMSQYGAKALAEQGRAPEAIINHYYRDVEIEKQWQ